MRLARILGLTLSALLFGGAAASADTVTITANGVWGAGAPISNWSAPGETWSFSLALSSPTPVSEFAGNPDDLVTTSIIGFSYALNGSAVAIPPQQVHFFTLLDGGGLEIDFAAGGSDTTNNITCSASVPCSFDTFGDQLFTGGVPNITLQQGATTAVDFDYTAAFLSQAGVFEDPGTGTANSLTVSPEPATFALFGAGVLGLFWKKKQHWFCRRSKEL